MAVEAHPVGVAIRQLVENADEWSGEPAQLLQALNGLVTDEQRHAKAWPKNVLSLGHILRRLAPALRRTGIAYERDRSTRRTIQLSIVGKKPSESSEPSENRAEKDNPDGPDGFDDFSPTSHVSTCGQQNAAATHPDLKPVPPIAAPIVGDESAVDL